MWAKVEEEREGVVRVGANGGLYWAQKTAPHARLRERTAYLRLWIQPLQNVEGLAGVQKVSHAIAVICD